MSVNTHINKKRTVVGVLGLPVNKEGKFLVTLRNEPQHPETHKKWQITGGGVEFGETPEETLSREMQEELAVSVRVIYPYAIARSHVWQFKSGSFHVLLLCYLVDIGDQKPKVDGVENLDYKWIKPGEIFDMEYLPLTDDFLIEGDKLIKEYRLIDTLI
jgi:8-oxo-dGTP diphosphatase